MATSVRMGSPSIEIVFKELGIAAITRGDQGIVALILRDAAKIEPFKLRNVTEIPKELSDYNKDQIAKAFMGYQTTPRFIYVYVQPAEAKDYTDALNYLRSVPFDWLAIPGIAKADTETIVTWIKQMRDQERKKVKAVLPNTKADYEGIVNFTSTDIKVGDKKYDTADYCARIAGLIAGTPLRIGCSFAPLPEVDDVLTPPRDKRDEAVDNGEFIIFNDGEKVKVNRAVNSFTTMVAEKLESFKKIKIVEAMDLIFSDIKKTAEDHYLGKYPNTYNNKCLLITAIQAYFESLEMDQIVALGSTNVSLDLAKQINHLRRKGVDVDKMSVRDIKNADTGSHVYLLAKTKILDAIEDIHLDIVI